MRRKFTIKNGQKKSHLIKKTKQDGVGVKQQQSRLFGKYTAQNKPFEQAKWPAQSSTCLDASCHTNGERFLRQLRDIAAQDPHDNGGIGLLVDMNHTSHPFFSATYRQRIQKGSVSERTSRSRLSSLEASALPKFSLLSASAA
jgi:hypothetical protein